MIDSGSVHNSHFDPTRRIDAPRGWCGLQTINVFILLIIMGIACHQRDLQPLRPQFTASLGAT
jgi:hypothetical protein